MGELGRSLSQAAFVILQPAQLGPVSGLLPVHYLTVLSEGAVATGA